MRKAAEGFPNALQLMTVGTTARNTEIPFVVLKHRVLSEGKPLSAAIAEFEPELNEVEEAESRPRRGPGQSGAAFELSRLLRRPAGLPGRQHRLSCSGVRT